MPFNLMSAADPQGRCRSFVEANMRSQKPTHWFHDLEAQTESRPCTIHPYARQCESSPMPADVGICGTPCHPYSFQRVGRHRPGSVQGHAEFEVGMRTFLTWLEKHQPKAQIYEQVLGFCAPFHPNSTTTPMDKPLGKRMYRMALRLGNFKIYHLPFAHCPFRTPKCTEFQNKQRAHSITISCLVCSGSKSSWGPLALLMVTGC